MSSAIKKKMKQYPFHWVVESLMEEPGYLGKNMFGCLAIYLHVRLALLLSSGAEPWNGLLVPTEHQYHGSICQDFNHVVQHPVLKKWLYLPEASGEFETVALDIVEAIRTNDLRFGVEPKEKKRKKKIKALKDPPDI